MYTSRHLYSEGMMYIFNYIITDDLNETLKFTFIVQIYSRLYILKILEPPPPLDPHMKKYLR